jgi:hypothetical protein
MEVLMRTKTLLLIVALCFLTFGVAGASNLPTFTDRQISPSDVMYPGNFPTAGDAYCSATNGCGNIPAGGQTAYMWTRGDYVVSSLFTNTGITSATDLTVNFLFQNYMGGGNTETVNYYINGVAVAFFVAPDCNYCGTDYLVSGTVQFADIAPVGGGYTLEMILQNTIPPGGGSIAFLDGGTFTLSGTSTPEPSSIMLFGSGVLGLASVLRRKLRP